MELSLFYPGLLEGRKREGRRQRRDGACYQEEGCRENVHSRQEADSREEGTVLQLSFKIFVIQGF